jgi:transposase-like protein
MRPLFPRLPFEHGRQLGKPSCPRCGNVCLFPELTKYEAGAIRSEWCCTDCTLHFETLVGARSVQGSAAA